MSELTGNNAYYAASSNGTTPAQANKTKEARLQAAMARVREKGIPAILQALNMDPKKADQYTERDLAEYIV